MNKINEEIKRRDNEVIVGKAKEINELYKELEEANQEINLHIRLVEESDNEKQEERYQSYLKNWKTEKSLIINNLSELIK